MRVSAWLCFLFLVAACSSTGGQDDAGAADDSAAGADSATAPDLAVRSDMASGHDLAVGHDLAAPRDLAVVHDLAVAPDFATVADLAAARDLATAPDMACPSPWQAGSCATVVATTTATVGELAATSEGLFWNADGLQADSALVELPFGASAPVTLGATAWYDLDVVVAADTVYAYTGGTASGSAGQTKLFVKPAGGALETMYTAKLPSLVYADGAYAYFAQGASIYTPYAHVERAALPTCSGGGACVLGAATTFYAGDEQWPASPTATGGAGELWFVSPEYGNYPINDIKRTSSRILAQPLASGAASTAATFSDKIGPTQLVFAGGGLYYILGPKIGRIDAATGALTTVYAAASGAPAPYHLATDGTDVFWIDASQQLDLLRAGAKTPVVLAHSVDYGIPYNLALTSDAVYFTAGGRRTILRWMR